MYAFTIHIIFQQDNYLLINNNNRKEHISAINSNEGRLIYLTI